MLANEELVLFKELLKLVGSSDYDHSAGYAHTALTGGFSKSFGTTASTATILDIQKSDMLLVIKTDAYETHPVIGFEINKAVKNKAVKLTILSDKRGKLGKLPGAQTLVHAPGTEISLINALANAILDEKLAAGTASSVPGFAELEQHLSKYAPEAIARETGLDAIAIRQAARDYAAAEKAMIIFPVGLAYPGHNAELASAVANLAILTGKTGTEGSGVLCMAEKNNSQGAVDMGFYPANGARNAIEILNDCTSRFNKNPFHRWGKPGGFLSRP